MPHGRQQIREAAAAALTGLTTTGTRVYQSRVHPLADNKLPCLLVETNSEQITVESVHAPSMLQRELTLTVRAVAKVTGNLDDTLDTMVAEVETAIGNTTLGGKVKSLVLESIATEMSGESDRPVGVLTMNWRAVYFTVSNAPNTII